MLQYLVILLDDTSTSFCHYDNSRIKSNLISLEDLKAGIFYAMKENLMIQFVYPNYELPQEYKDVINTIDHSVIVSALCEDSELKDKADVVVMNDWNSLGKVNFTTDTSYVLRTTKSDLFDKYQSLTHALGNVRRLNIVFTDVESFTEEDFDKSVALLEILTNTYVKNKSQLSSLVDDLHAIEEEEQRMEYLLQKTGIFRI